MCLPPAACLTYSFVVDGLNVCRSASLQILSYSKFMTLFPSCLKPYNLHLNETTVSAFKGTELINCITLSNIKKISTFARMCIYVFRIIVRLKGDY
jgi:hypothetical protein